jgi:hypothetical protein
MYNILVFKTLRTLTQSKQSGINLIEDKHGQLLAEKKPIMKRGKEYCRKLCNYKLEY